MRNMMKTCFLLLVSGSILTPLYADEPISFAELKKYAEMVRTYEPVDQFDVGPDLTKLVGRSFSFEIKPRAIGPNNKICPGTPSWGYSKDTRNFSVSYGTWGISLGDYWSGERKMMDRSLYAAIYGIDCSFTYGVPYEASNSTGVSVTVFVVDETFLAVNFLKDVTEFQCCGVSWSSVLEPNKARSLSKTIRGRVSGKIGQWPSGQPIVCGVDTDEPTISAPLERNYRGCFVNAQVDLVELVNTANGEVLKSRKPYEEPK